jgi:hypothetical protein
MRDHGSVAGCVVIPESMPGESLSVSLSKAIETIIMNSDDVGNVPLSVFQNDETYPWVVCLPQNKNVTMTYSILSRTALEPNVAHEDMRMIAALFPVEESVVRACVLDNSESVQEHEDAILEFLKSIR